MRMRSKLIRFIILVIVILTTACDKGELPDIEKSHSITIIYLEANNNLRAEALKALNDLEIGIGKDMKSVGTVLAYIKNTDKIGYLLNIQPDNDPYTINSDTIKIFESTSKSDGGQMKRVLSFIKESYKAEDYNLILWSHGTSWTPARNPSPSIGALSFGEDRGQNIDLLEIKDALPMQFNYIIFDACAMASIEVLYELRHKAKYIIASPTDVLSEGFPYQNIVEFFGRATKQNVIQLATKYFEYYDQRSGLLRSAAISVTDLSKLEELSSCLDSINQKQNHLFKTAGIQRLDFTQGFPVQLYDFKDFIDHTYSDKDKLRIDEILKKTLIYRNHTPEFLGNRIDAFSGMTISLLKRSDVFFPYYSGLEWSKKTNIDLVK